MRSHKTKYIQKDRSVRKTQQRPQPIIPPGVRRRLYNQIKEINRQETCPFLVRVFYAINEENHYKGRGLADLPVEREIKLHLWQFFIDARMNSTLKEISELLRAHLPSIRTKQRFVFWRLTLNKEKKEFEKQEIGWVYASRRYDRVQEKALCHTKFKIGDLLDVSILYK